MKFFLQLAKGVDLFGTVYSVVDGVCSLELYERIKLSNTSINEVLIQHGYAQRCTESFLSQDDHTRRLQVQERDDEDKSSINAVNAAIEADPWTRGDEQNIPPPPFSECRRSMNLRGPHSPLEMQIYSLVKCGEQKSVNIEWNSVNSVLLDTNPQDEHDRLLVAGSISTSTETGKLTLRHTTMMPNLRGFPALMALLFCPRAVVHTNKNSTRVTSVLCGLGCDRKSNKPRYDAHDITLNLDFELTPEDMLMVNEIREYMNIMMETVRRTERHEPVTHPTENCQAEIQNRIRQ